VLALLRTAFLLRHPAACRRLIFWVLTLSLPSEPFKTENTVLRSVSIEEASEH
jgi:hypothetical protein